LLELANQYNKILLYLFCLRFLMYFAELLWYSII